jgi:hypothetical protein
MEIKQKLYQKLKKKIDFHANPANDFNLVNAFNLDTNNYLSIIFYTRYDNKGMYGFNHYVLEYDLTKKRIIDYYRITQEDHYDFMINKDYLYVSHNVFDIIDSHVKTKRFQLYIYKRRVI